VAWCLWLAEYGLGEAAVGTLTDAIVKEAKEKGFG